MQYTPSNPNYLFTNSPLHRPGLTDDSVRAVPPKTPLHRLAKEVQGDLLQPRGPDHHPRLDRRPLHLHPAARRLGKVCAGDFRNKVSQLIAVIFRYILF